MTKTEIRYRIDTLIRCAKITSNDNLREEWVVEAVNLLNAIEEKNVVDNPIKTWCDKYAVVTDGKVGYRMKRSDVYDYYLFCRMNESGLPHFTRNAFYQELENLNIPLVKSCGTHWFGILRKELK